MHFTSLNIFFKQGDDALGPVRGIDMIKANIIKAKWKGGRNRHNNSQYFIGKE